jgi:hypothetical protein
MPQLGDDYPVPYERTFDGTVGFEITEIASEATAVGVWDDGKIGLGLANHTNFLRPVTGGVVVAGEGPAPARRWLEMIVAVAEKVWG